MQNTTSKSTYDRVFFNDFNLSFYRPKKATCWCQRPLVDMPDKKRSKLNNHRQEALAVRTYRDNLKEKVTNENITAAVFDLEQVLPLPKTTDGYLYYKGQSNNYNLSMYGWLSRQKRMQLHLE